MDDLTRYVFNNYPHLMMVREHVAYKSILGEQKAQKSNSPAMSAMLRRTWVSSDPQVRGLLAEGSDAFMVNVRDRILREHGSEMFVNLCPRCGALARTPRAEQCPQCFHSWRGAALYNDDVSR